MKKSEGKSFVVVSYFDRGEERVLDKMEFSKSGGKGR